MSAEYLRETAALMRERAEAVPPPPWEVSYIDPAVCATSTDQWFVMSDPHGVNVGPVSIHEWEPSAHYAASWHPAVALAVADWLDAVAGWREEFDSTGGAGHPVPFQREALAVARAYRGDSDD